MSQALYRKYRSKSFDDIVGQEGIVTALQNAIKNNAISHAYLFTGPRGTGKTSIARIFAYAVNNIPYTSDELPVDIIEIDAASNRGIEEIRELRERVRLAPMSAKYKVYIIDEVHMLTTHAFNALLKTLEEPPKHVIFILATTESHKLPETITSRTQRYNFTLAPTTLVTKHLARIAKEEAITIEPEALALIATHSGGSLRDALSILDHARHVSDSVTAHDVRVHIGLPSTEIIDGIIRAIAHQNPSEIMHSIENAQSAAVPATIVASSLMQSINISIRDNAGILPISTATSLLRNLLTVEYSAHPDTALKVAMLSVIDDVPAQKSSTMPKQPTVTAPQPATVDTQPSHQKSSKKSGSQLNTQQVQSPHKEQPQKTPSPQTAPPDEATEPFTQDVWIQILEDIRASHNTLYSVLRMATLQAGNAQNGTITLEFAFPFHQKRLNEAKNRDVLHEKLTQAGYSNIMVECVVNKNTTVSPPPIITPKEPKNDELSAIQNVFGTVEDL